LVTLQKETAGGNAAHGRRQCCARQAAMLRTAGGGTHQPVAGGRVGLGTARPHGRKGLHEGATLRAVGGDAAPAAHAHARMHAKMQP
jgi:hypothetical protein